MRVRVGVDANLVHQPPVRSVQLYRSYTYYPHYGCTHYGCTHYGCTHQPREVGEADATVHDRSTSLVHAKHTWLGVIRVRG